MSSLIFSSLFIFFLILMICIKSWLASRQIQYVLVNKDQVPAEFAEKISLAAHQKAAHYTIVKTKFDMVTFYVNIIVLLGFTLLGGLQHLVSLLSDFFNKDTILYQLSIIVSFMLISGIINIPFSYYKQFVIEEKFGFNKMTLGLFISDLIKNTIVGMLIGLPLIWVILIVMEFTGTLWWFYAWAIWSAFQLLMMVLYPTVIAPLFNKFTPLQDEELKAHIENLMHRTGFMSKGLFVMDGSKRSAHGNAYFSGFGANKRIVFFDTLLSRLTPNEVEAVLAHELGHFKLKHIIKRIVSIFVLSFVFLGLLGYLKQQVWFYTGLGMAPLENSNDAVALILFMLTLPIFTFIFSPLSALISRKHEFEADAFAVKHTNAHDLTSALVKLYEDNASTLTPDPIHSAFYDSHPPATIRIQHLHAHSA